MTLEEFASALSQIGIPLAFQSFRESPGTPRMTYAAMGEKPAWADNNPFFSFLRIELKLYTSVKDTSTETRVEAFFSDHDMAWKKDEAGNAPDSEVYTVKYTLEV